MKVFFKRLGESLFKLIGSILTFLVVGAISLVIVSIVASLVIVLPIWTFSFIIGDWCVLWLPLLIIVLLSIDKWENIKEWITWQFVEPFKK